jgi:hypothetical protein
MGPIPRRPYELMFERLYKKDQPLDAIHKACSGTKGIFGVGWDIDYERPKSDLFEKRCTAASGATSSPATTPRSSTP